MQNGQNNEHRQAAANTATVLQPLPPVPGVSYVMPVLNEAETLATAVTAVLSQEYAGEQELILALGPSTDGTTEIAAALATQNPALKTVQNPARDIPAGLNLAIAAAKHEVIIRVDAHSELPTTYTATAVAILQETQAANTGGIMRAAGTGRMQEAIAACYNSPFGLGGGAYHGEAAPHAAESAYLGCFRRSAWEAVGGFDETVLRGEDWEFNLRLRRKGLLVWFTPKLQVTYWPRNTLSALAKQFWATGAWRAELVRRYGRANPWRFFLPGALVLALALSALALVLLCCGGYSWAPWLSLFLLPACAYAAGIIFATVRIPAKNLTNRLDIARVLITMHICWGAGFLRGILTGPGKTVDKSRIR